MGIPLVALSVRPPEQADAVGSIGRAMQIRQLAGQNAMIPGQLQQQQQGLEQGQQQIEAQKRAVADQQAQTKTMQEWDGKDYTQIPALILKNGGSANAVFAASQNIMAQREKLATIAKDDADTQKNNLDNQVKQNDEYRGRLQSIISAPAEQKQALWEQEVAKEEQSGMVQPGQISHTYPGDAEATVIANHFALGTVLAKEASEKQQAQARQDLAASSQQRADEEQKQNAIRDAETARHNRAMESIQSGGAGGALSDTARDQAAARYATTGQLPPGPRGAAGLAQSRSIMNRAAELQPQGSITANSAEYKANSDSLKGLQKNFDMVTAFENTAGKNLDQFLGTAKQISDSGSPLFNKPWHTVQSSLEGNPQLAAYGAARATALTEIAKVLNSSNASGVLSDSARSEVGELIKPDASFQQIQSAANILKQDMANRHQAYQQQIGDIQKRLGGAGQGQGGTQQPTAQTHQFSLSAWKRANPQGDENAAKAAAQQAGYTVTQ